LIFADSTRSFTERVCDILDMSFGGARLVVPGYFRQDFLVPEIISQAVCGKNDGIGGEKFNDMGSSVIKRCVC